MRWGSASAHLPQQQQQLAAFIHDDDEFCQTSYVISARLLCGSRHSYKRVFPSLITLPVVEPQQPLLQAHTLLFCRQSLRWVRFEVSVLRHLPEGRGYLAWRTLSALGSVLDKFSSLASPKLALVFGVCTLGGLSIARFTGEWAVILIS